MTPPLSAPETIARRRTTRTFDPSRPVSDTLLARLLRLATLAPSDHNLQPWRFLVVRRVANRRKLRACAFNQSKLTDAPVVVIVLGYLTPERSHLQTVIDQRLVLGAVDANEAAELQARATLSMTRLSDRVLWATRSTMLAASTLLIAAESHGVSSALIAEFDPAKVKDAFGVPDDHTICGLIALGYAFELPPFPGRLFLADVCFEEHFGQPWTLGDGMTDGQ